MRLKTLLATTAICSVGFAANAQEVGELSVGIGATSYGASLEVQYGISPNLAVRGMLMGGFSLDDTFEVDEGTLDGELTLGGLAVVADYYPFANPWRVSGGLFFSNTSATGDYVGDTNFSAELAFENEVVPMLTTGFNYPIASGWSVSGDIGVLVTSLEVSSDAEDAEAQTEIDDINNDLADIPVLPYIGFAVNYSF